MTYISRFFRVSIFLFAMLAASADMSGQIVGVGNGSYTTQFPGVDQAGRNGFPSGTPFTTGVAATKPVPTNDWWSAQIKNQHADNLFNYPYTLKTINDGLVVSYIPSGVIDDQHPVIVGVDGLNASAANVSDFSDWTVTMDWANGAQNFQATAGIGMPFLYFSKAATDEAKITVNGGTVTITDEMMVITNAHRGADFAVYAPVGSTWVQNGNSYTSTLNGKNYWSMAFIPLTASNVMSVATEYKKYAYVFPTNTTTAWNYNESTSVMRTDFVIETEVKEGSETNVLQGLLPHQWDNLSSDSPTPNGYTYQTIRGPLKSLDGNTFSVENTFFGILPTLPYLDNYSETFSPVALSEKVQLLENEGLATWTDSYNQGQELNRLIQTARIADLMDNTGARDKIVATVKERLEDWLKAESGEVAFLFHYNQTWSALIGYPAGHGQDNNINDHHFHWGYFIHAAAFVEQFDPGWSSQWGSMIDHLVRDAASDDRDDTMYPFLRNFSPYAGHSWANGFATFPQGNDQESTSESMQFNSALIHWGTITGNDEIRDLGIYLYTTEQTAIEEYWLDIHNRIFEPSHPYSLVSRVWGNSYDNGTFFTADIAASYGIELYPIHGGSLYLGHHTSYAEQLWAEIAQNTGILSNEANVNLWHDIMWEYLAFTNPEQAIQLYDSYPERDLKFGVSDAQTYHWLHSMNALGTVDITVTADYPIAAAFDTDGALTYVAHNYGSDPISVTFSDGYVLDVPARSMATSRDLSIAGLLSSTYQQAYPGGGIELTVAITGGTADSVEIYSGDDLVGHIGQTPYTFPVSDLTLGIHSYYARIYKDGDFNTTNTVSVQVGNQISFQTAPLVIPGSFQAGHYDVFEGGIGQNISYNDVTPANHGDTRTTEYVDAFDGGAEGDAVGWIAAGEWLEYTVSVMQPGYYTLDFRYASGNSAGGGPFGIASDGASLVTGITVNHTGGWDSWATKTVSNIPLKGGEQVLRLFFESGEFNIADLTFGYDRPLDFDQPIADAGSDILVVLPQSSTALDASSSTDSGMSSLSYSWEQIYGPSTLVFSDQNAINPTISTLEEGVYLIKLIVDNGVRTDSDELFVISSTASNFAPEVSLSSPTQGANLQGGSTITVSAAASDLGGSIVQVAFFANGQSIGISTAAPYSIEWTPTSGDYNLTAVATDNDGGTTTSAAVPVSVTDPPSLDGTWKLSPEPMSLGVGPNLGDLGWWNCNASCVTERACLFDDKYVFGPDGTFQNVLGSASWIESWQGGGAEGCKAPVAPHDGSNAATWSLSGNMLTISGRGAYLGLAKVNNSGELSSPANAPASITYPVEFNAAGDVMTIDINYGSGVWHFVLVKDISTSTQEIQEDQFSVYPNPVSDILTLEMPLGRNQVRIYDLTGRVVSRLELFGETYSYDMSAFHSGLYIVELRNALGAQMFKVVKD